VAVDLVEPMETGAHGPLYSVGRCSGYSRRNSPPVARALDQNVFGYLGLLEQIHTDQGAQFQSQLMGDLCRILGVNQSRTTPYHPQGNGVVERNNRMLGDALRSLLFGRGQEEWDVVLPQIMRAYRSTPHSATQETPNFLMLGWNMWVPENLAYHVPTPESPVHEYVGGSDRDHGQGS